MRHRFLAVFLLCASCIGHREEPARYDLGASVIVPDSQPRLNALVVVPAMQSPSWLSTTAVIYRLDYDGPMHARSYTRSRWTAPPSELLTLRLRERVAEVNDGFTVTRLLEGTGGFVLETTLENFMQFFPSRDHSSCLVTVNAIVAQQSHKVLAEKTFRIEQQAPSGDGPGAVKCLADASNSEFSQILAWLRSTLPAQQRAAMAAEVSAAH